jgi:hypothetical protein
MTTTPAVPSPYPAALTGRLAPDLSRWLWLVKWFLLIPHIVVLFFLGIAAFVTTVISGFAILFTGRYPRSLFDFSVGVLRWGWRVAFYGYSALGTDQYPPFTLASTDYPADFDVAYPERLSRGLVLVKWWLLAIPHYVVVAVITGGSWAASNYQRTGDASHDGGTYTTDSAAWSLLGILVLVAAVILLVTARYPRPLFRLIMGLNRWTWRVYAYTLLLTDTYPPFRLDQGGLEPSAEQRAASLTDE